MTGEQIERTKGTRFQKGQPSRKKKPIGSTRVCSKDGYVLVKVAGKKACQLKHRVIYEEHYGPIPKNMVVTFVDGNRLNLDITNLLLISQRENSLINKKGLRNDDEDLNESGIHLGRVISKINELKK